MLEVLFVWETLGEDCGTRSRVHEWLPPGPGLRGLFPPFRPEHPFWEDNLPYGEEFLRVLTAP